MKVLKLDHLCRHRKYTLYIVTSFLVTPQAENFDTLQYSVSDRNTILIRSWCLYLYLCMYLIYSNLSVIDDRTVKCCGAVCCNLTENKINRKQRRKLRPSKLTCMLGLSTTFVFVFMWDCYNKCAKFSGALFRFGLRPVIKSVTSGFRRDADELCAFLGYNAVSSGIPLPTFRDNVSVPSSRVKKSKKSSHKMFKTHFKCMQFTWIN
jgi:hypothetical protein